jgi:hypothetical protein
VKLRSSTNVAYPYETVPTKPTSIIKAVKRKHLRPKKDKNESIPTASQEYVVDTEIIQTSMD